MVIFEPGRMGGGTSLSLVVLFILSYSNGLKFSVDDNIDSCELSPILVPNLYDLKFELDYPSRSFRGEVIITGQVLSETKVLLLDSGVTVEDATLYRPQDGLTIQGQLNDQFTKKIEIEFETPLVPETEYQLKLNFIGEIRLLRGIYGGNYTSPDNQESYFIATEFQPNYASYAFPCIDRPAYKAHFLLNVSREVHQVALSNMPLSSSRPDSQDGNKIWDSFEKTPLMSTYTFAFVVGDLVAYTPEDYYDPSNNTVWVIRGNERLASLASKWAPVYVKTMELYTNETYDLPKLDHVALPYMASTAMEHWGVITYKQDVILIDEITHTVRSEFGLIWIMAHEIAHQWFGNLVTCSSWSYTWLNEGITSFLHFLISGKVFPEWDMLGLMMTEEVLKVMDDEGFSAVSLTKEDCVTEASDTFSMAPYYKGAAIMRTVYFMIGEEEVRKGLQSYVKANKYGCVNQEDLWVHFNEAAEQAGTLPNGKDLSTVMKTWSNNQGFPVIIVKRTEKYIKLEQIRLVFFLPDDSPDQKWWVPLSYTTSLERNFSNTLPRTWMNPEEEETCLDVHLNKNDWILFNIQQSAYYRVMYDELTWTALTRQLMTDMEVIPPINRAKLIDDVFTLAFYKKMPYNTPLNLLRYLVHEDHYYPWSAAIRALDHIHFYIKASEINTKFQQFLLKLVEKVFNTLSYYNDYNDSYRDINSRLLYGKILHFACSLGHKRCEDRAREMMTHLLSGDDKFKREHIDEVYPLMCTMVKLGGQDIWDLAFQMYKKERVFKPRDELMDALKCTTDKNVWKKLTRNVFEGAPDYETFDLLTSGVDDKNNYCYIIEVIDEMLEENNEKIELLVNIINDLSGVPLPEKCSEKLKSVTEKHVEDEEIKDEILKTIEKSKKPWIRLREIENWFDDQTNQIDSSSGSNENSDNNLKERSIFGMDGMEGVEDAVDLPPYPHHRSPHDYDYESRHGEASQINSSSSIEFNLYILIFSVLPSPIYLTYLLFAPLI